MWDNGSVDGLGPAGTGFVFPNWKYVPVMSADVLLCLATSGCAAGPENIKAVTVVNFGTAKNTDFAAVYWQASCGATTTPLYPMTYAGVYAEDAGSVPAWTWAGTTVDLSACADLCGGTCGATYTINVYADLAPCPVPLRTVKMGFPIRTTSTWGFDTSVQDNYGCDVPYYDLSPQQDMTIAYVYKESDVAAAAPGDTVTFTVYYGRPGANPLTGIEIIDTLPPYTHYVTGSAAPAADAGYDPNWGPPVLLRWSLPGGAITGGPTGLLTFDVTVDWGNGEGFEPGSGDVAAPEGSRLMNGVTATFQGTSCAPAAYATPPVTTVVRRFLFWMVGDNDLLFSPSLGQSPDEMTYTVSIKNTSSTKTWWNVSLWDSVPPELNSWCIGCGFDDPCAGWTMTPSGCAAATPGRTVSGPTTLLTWRLDMPPNYTVDLRWKAQVKPTTPANATAINRISVLEYGRSNIIDGTGYSGVTANFTHLALIVLPTTYISYLAYDAGDNAACPGYFIDFFPLNKKAQFELRGIQYTGAGWSSTGGASQSIGCLIGDCLGGFPGSPGCTLGAGTLAIPGGGTAGCKVERIPARYNPTAWQGTCPPVPWAFVFKLTANAPVLWQMLTHIDNCNQDRHTYAPSTTLTYAGFMHYSWRGDLSQYSSLSLINTGRDSYGAFPGNLNTTAHVFQWDPLNLAWSYRTTLDIGPEGQASILGTTPADDDTAYRVLSSDAALIIDAGETEFTTSGCCCCSGGDNHVALAPTGEDGKVVSGIGAGTLYGIDQPVPCSGGQGIVLVYNIGAIDAKYEVQLYTPNSTVGQPAIPAPLRDTGGTWASAGIYTVPAGLANAGNPDIYQAAPFNLGANNLFRIRVLAGGPVQVYTGTHTSSQWAGGAVFHSPTGGMTGPEFWHTMVPGESKGCPDPAFGVSVFAPKTSMVIRAQSEDGYTARYTTSGPDQCVMFLSLTQPTVKRNYKFDVPSGGNVTALYNQCKSTEKGYTAPFLSFGTHYQIVVPPIVYAGQSFWLTVIVLDAAGGTQTDYCGTSSFTSTDPSAVIQGSAMDGFNYTWDSNDAAATCKGAGCVGGCDNGVKVFVNVTYTDLGLQTIVVTDTADGSISGLAAFVVVGADIKLEKLPRLTVGASGDTVQFRVCWSNYSSASGFTFVITDSIPQGTTFLPEAGTAAFDCGNTKGSPPSVAYSTTASATPPAAFTTGNPLAGAVWLRWTIPQVGVFTTGCICYRVTVN